MIQGGAKSVGNGPASRCRTEGSRHPGLARSATAPSIVTSASYRDVPTLSAAPWEGLMRWMVRVALGVAVAAAGGMAFGQVPLGPYVGAGYGHATLEEDDSSVSLHIDDGSDSWKLYGGMRLISFLDL